MSETTTYSYNTAAEVAGKVEWEGGVIETAVDYGLRVDDINPEVGELRELWVQLQDNYREHVAPIQKRIQAILDEAENADGGE